MHRIKCLIKPKELDRLGVLSCLQEITASQRERNGTNHLSVTAVNLAELAAVMRDSQTTTRPAATVRTPASERSVATCLAFAVDGADPFAEQEVHHHHKCAHKATRAVKIPNRSRNLLPPHDLRQRGARSKNQNTRSKNTRKIDGRPLLIKGFCRVFPAQ
jgi:hypothetical protein